MVSLLLGKFVKAFLFLQARNVSGVSEEALREFSMMFKHFDKDKSGRLDHREFKSCLRALGYDLPLVEDGQEESPEFESILSAVDPNRDGHVSLQVSTDFASSIVCWGFVDATFICYQPVLLLLSRSSWLS